MEFVKMEGLGNDFVVIPGPEDLDANEITQLCDRRRGVGADGLLVVTPIDPESIRMEYWNADGSVAEMCGNGLRCSARLAADRGWIESPTFTVVTNVGRRHAEVSESQVRVELGPIDAQGLQHELIGYELATVSVGNPHAVAFVDDCYTVPLDAVGPIVEGDPTYPQRTNVEFATVIGSDRLALRVWERGVGETLACGTGAAAAVAEALRSGRTGPEVTVLLPGGELLVEIIDGAAWITGPARTVFVGEV